MPNLNNNKNHISRDAIDIKVSNNSATVAIFGSCVTRNSFNTKFNKGYKKFFKVVATQYQTTILSLMSPPIIYKPDSLLPLEGWDLETTEREIKNTFLGDLILLKPDILLIDFFADANFRTIPIGNSYLTVNEWKIAKTKFFKYRLKRKESFFPSEDKLKEKLQELYDCLKNKLPATKIILNKAKGVMSYLSAEGEELFFYKQYIRRVNSRWELIDNLFIEIANPIIIDVLSPSAKGNPNHHSGIGFVHYTEDFYHDMLNALISIQFKDVTSSHLPTKVTGETKAE